LHILLPDYDPLAQRLPSTSGDSTMAAPPTSRATRDDARGGATVPSPKSTVAPIVSGR
jgi:hypothetical protein